MESIGGIPVGLAAHLREAVVSIAPDGLIEWANDAALRLMRIDRDAFVGTSPIDRLHEDEVARALDGIAFSSTAPDRTAVVPFRIRRGDDTWLDVELMSSVVEREDGDHLVLILRDATPRRAVAEALAHVAAGAPLDETAPWLARVIEARWKGVIAAVLIDHGEARRLVGADQWPSRLQRAVLDERTGDDWWTSTIDVGDVAIIDGDEIPASVRSVAQDLGYTTFAIAPVHDPAGGGAALLAWFDLAAAAYMEFAHASVELRELLALALDRQQHLAALDHAVRHDVLTGLLNRAGFAALAEQLTGELRARREIEGHLDASHEAAPARRVALLYLDLDGFKPVNDLHGHSAGDAVLRAVAERLTAVSGSWSAARIGGDEFVLLGIGGTTIEDEAVALATSVVAVLGEPIDVVDDEGREVQVSIGASVGLAVSDVDNEDVQRLLERADGAMYAVKAGGGRSWSALVT